MTSISMYTYGQYMAYMMLLSARFSCEADLLRAYSENNTVSLWRVGLTTLQSHWPIIIRRPSFMLLDLEARLARTSATARQLCGLTQAYQHYDSLSPMKAETSETALCLYSV